MERGDDGSYSFSIKALSVMHHRFAAWGALPASDLTPADRACTVPLPLNVDVMKAVVVQGVHFAVGDWVLARPNAANGDLSDVLDGDAELHLPRHGVPKILWFGKIRSLFVHRFPAGQGHDIADVEWHKSLDVGAGGPYDVDLQSPIVYRRAAYAVTEEQAYMECSAIVPLKMAVMAHPSRPDCFAMIRRTWHPLAVLDLPVPWPALMM